MFIRKPTSIRKPHNHLAGYVFERKHPAGHIVCFVAEAAGIDADHKYVVTLESDDPRIGPSFTSLPKARLFVHKELAGRSGWDWQLN
tara:strand:+ start:662 stop:922 length:261 start_codon:yes stop_codon:yes gene_type:complete